MWPGFKSRRRHHTWVEFVVGSLHCSERFFSGYSGFPLSSKTNIFKFQFDQESGRQRITLWMCYLQIIIIIYYYYYYLAVIITVIIIIIIIITSDTGIKVNFNYFTLYKASSLNLKII